MAMDLLDPCFERHFRTERTNDVYVATLHVQKIR
jgi:hypothetical protein